MLLDHEVDFSAEFLGVNVLQPEHHAAVELEELLPRELMVELVDKVQAFRSEVRKALPVDSEQRLSRLFEHPEVNRRVEKRCLVKLDRVLAQIDCIAFLN